MVRELFAEYRPVICEVGRRQYGDREAAVSHAALDLGDDYTTQRQRIDQQHPRRRQVERREQVAMHEVGIVRGMDDEQIV